MALMRRESNLKAFKQLLAASYNPENIAAASLFVSNVSDLEIRI
jgi:hypothetical protein